MDFASPLSDLVKYLWGSASTHLGYIYNVKHNVDKLRMETEDLNAKNEDVKARVEREEGGGGVCRTREVANWLEKVQKFLGEEDQVLREARERDRIKCLGHGLPQNCWSGYQLGKTVDRMLNEARELKKEEFNTMLPLPPPPVLMMPMDETVGLDISFNKVLKWLVDEKEIRVIGLYGTGGVGKTTLMKRINNDLSCANYGFDVVIWVVVSRKVNEDKIQDTIRRGLHIKDDIWQQWSENGANHIHLFEVLTQKKFVLLIDDVWARLDLTKIGVPRSCLKNGSKVVFTTRSKTVCHQMGADEAYEVQCLTLEEALGLFENNVGKSTTHFDPEIQELAKNIVLECKGLPLALITVGRAMASKDNPSEWRHALTTLRSRPHKLQGMVEEVYHILEFSYDSLNDTTRQACFLYCCRFPEDYPIMTYELIELWIGEGLLGDTGDVYHKRDEGASILGDLKRACLLESEHHDGCPVDQETVKMHDVIRDMATWIVRDHGQRENKLLVIENEEDMSTEMISKWREAENVSIWGNLIAKINQAPPMCSQLETLFVRETKVSLVPRGFFKSMMACLKVLDLSGNEKIESFPKEICNLISLQYLNLSRTNIKELPEEIKNLTRLRWLLLDNIRPYDSILILTGAIASLPLNVFSLWHSGPVTEEKVVEELGNMQNLTDLSIRVQKSFFALKIFRSLQRCIRRVRIKDCKDLTSIPISHPLKGSGDFSHLEVLELVNCPMLVKMEITQGIGRAPNCFCFPSLVKVFVHNCGFLDLSWLVHAPKLRELEVSNNPSMEKIIEDGFAREELATSRLFSCLKILSTYNLPNLRSICDDTLFFPQGMEFHIHRCRGLRKLPLDSNSTRGSFSIAGDKDWWAKFEWDPTAWVTLKMDYESPAKEMTFGEAKGKMQDGNFSMQKIEFLPSRAE
ncbi:disease resistance protein RPS5-like [Rutidosis leptorrhynchoides]|uniref:disease resistance protein RPS5-like n=1 Tax=Rutidosis leptorrhynchoides TaxID=125765 RepID=UPI003A996C83